MWGSESLLSSLTVQMIIQLIKRCGLWPALLFARSSIMLLTLTPFPRTIRNLQIRFLVKKAWNVFQVGGWDETRQRRGDVGTNRSCWGENQNHANGNAESLKERCCQHSDLLTPSKAALNVLFAQAPLTLYTQQFIIKDTHDPKLSVFVVNYLTEIPHGTKILRLLKVNSKMWCFNDQCAFEVFLKLKSDLRVKNTR